VNSSTPETGWIQSTSEIFWGEIAPSEHVVQIYESDDIFIDTLAEFIGGGIKAGDSCIVIATDAHLKSLESKLVNWGVQLDPLISNNLFMPINAEELLSQFMVDDWPSERLFNQVITETIRKAGFRKRRIRAFGEMVALLWAKGLNGATVHLEHLWNKFCAQNSFCLFCAYPKSGFTHDINDSLRDICCRHSKLIKGSGKQETEVLYSEMVQTMTG
jgi:hypothetical protein